MRKKASIVDTWAKDHLRKVKKFLIETMEIYEYTHLLEKCMIYFSNQWKNQSNKFTKQIRVLKKIKSLGEDAIKKEDLLGGEDLNALQNWLDMMEFKRDMLDQYIAKVWKGIHHFWAR